MSTPMRRFTPLFATALLTSCGAAAVPPSTSACPIASGEWRAWVNAMPGPDAKPKLIAVGNVTAPTGGWTYAWRDLRTLESHPVQVVAELEATPPAGGATQAVHTQEIRGEWPMQQPVGSFTVRCGDQVLGRVAPVETAQ